MKQFLLTVFTLVILTFTVLPQNYDNAGMDYTKALFENKTTSSRIKALKSYIQTYTDTTNKFVKLAYYQLSLNYFEGKDYTNAIKFGEKTLSLGKLGNGEEARLNLVLANSYGIKSFSGFNKDKALKYTKKAIKLGKLAGDDKVVSTANRLKSSLSGPPPRKLSPEQKIKKLYSDEDFRGVINTFSSFSESIKNKEEISKIYGYALFKLKKYDKALKQFKNLYSKYKKGTYAKYIADIYAKRSRYDKSLYTQAAIFYLDASILYKNEGSSSNSKIAAGKAKVMLENKYGYKSKYISYQKEIKKQQSSSQKHTSEIRNTKKKIRDFKRYMRKTYRDVQAPQFEYDKLSKLEKRLEKLESGSSNSSSSNKTGEALVKLRKKIDSEYEQLLKSSKEKFNNN